MPIHSLSQPGAVPFLSRSILVIPAGEDAALAAGLRSGADILAVDISSLEGAARAEGCARIRDLLETRSTRGDNAGDPALFILLPPIVEITEALLVASRTALVDGVVLPGSPDIAAIQQLDVMLDVVEAEVGRDTGSVRIVAQMGLPPRQILAGISHRLFALGWSAPELAAMTGARRMHDSQGYLTDAFRQARAGVLIAAHAAGLEAVDSVSGLFSASRLQRDCAEAADDGFTGKFALSPRQVSPINLAFSPTEAEISEARAILKKGSAPTRVLARAARVLARSLLDADRVTD